MAFITGAGHVEQLQHLLDIPELPFSPLPSPSLTPAMSHSKNEKSFSHTVDSESVRSEHHFGKSHKDGDVESATVQDAHRNFRFISLV